MHTPVLFVSHGAPTLALSPGRAGTMLADATANIPRPRAVLALSAHWCSRGPIASRAATPETIHDFAGFPRALYDLRYPAPGAPDVAVRAVACLQGAGIAASTVPDRGLDHGTWVPLMLMYPGADIPVTQLSIQPHLGPAHHQRIGEALRPLRDEGVLILASGAVTHNLMEFGRFAEDAPAEPWAAAFAGWIADRIAACDTDALLDYRHRAPEAARNHPTPEHLLPLFVALGAAGKDTARRLDAGYTYGVFAMDAWLFEAP